jgi:two-component system chemotaxis sensor kinase CheA
MAMPDEELMRELMQTFSTEAAEHVQTINGCLLQLERSADETQRRDLLQEAFRAAHSLKGAARAVTLTDIERLADSIESVLQQARDLNAALNTNTCDVLYAMLDAITLLLAGQSADVEALRARLGSVINGSHPASADGEGIAQAEMPVTAESPAPVEMSAPMAAVEETIRVSVSKLDDLMAHVGELLVTKITAEQHLSDIQALHARLGQWPEVWREIKLLLPRVNGDAGRQLADVLERHHNQFQAVSQDVNQLYQSVGRDTMRLGMVTNGLQDEVRRVRMVPFQTLGLGLERIVRDAARSEGKQVTFWIEGADVELDKKVLETLKDSLLHLLRNAVSHGIELPEVRLKVGKPEEGKVSITVQQRGSEVRITVRDDGRGFDLAALRNASAHHNGHSLDDSASENEVIAVAFQPGVTTAEGVTALSGRGVGLDVVREQLEAIQGRIGVNNTPGQGVAIELVVPTSLAMTRGLLVRVGTERYVLPLLAIEKIVEVENSFSVSGKAMLTVDGKPLPLVSLAAALGRSETNTAQNALAVIIAVGDQRLALLVDDALSEQELAMKPLSKPLQRIPNVSGAALLGNGEPVLILNPANLVKSARGVQNVVVHQPEKLEDKPTAHILVVDDSITTRTLEKNILEAAHFRVTVAVDGVEAVKRLKENSIDLVVSDVQMPKMDGIALTQHLREMPEYSTLPIILVTSLESRDDRERGMMAGADAYIVKRGFNQAELLATIQRLL